MKLICVICASNKNYPLKKNSSTVGKINLRDLREPYAVHLNEIQRGQGLLPST